jgi:predicted enzyme related to lactoylglutathione lyase
MTETTQTPTAAQAAAIGGINLDLVVLDCPDPQALADFYAKLLGWAVESADDDWVTLRSREGGIGLAFQQANDYVAPTWPEGPVPQQFHLDINVADIEAAEPAVLALGAVKTGRPEPGITGFRVYLDPVGHPFCLCREG